MQVSFGSVPDVNLDTQVGYVFEGVEDVELLVHFIWANFGGWVGGRGQERKSWTRGRGGGGGIS